MAIIGHLSNKDLAKALGISAPMVTKLRQRGMPVDSVEAAETWRRHNLSPLHSKEHRMGGNSGGAKQSQAASEIPLSTCIVETKREQEFVAQWLFPMIFRERSELTVLLLDHLHSKCGLSEVDAMRAYELVVFGFVASTNEFFGYSNCFNGGGLSFKLPDLHAARFEANREDGGCDE